MRRCLSELTDFSFVSPCSSPATACLSVNASECQEGGIQKYRAKLRIKSRDPRIKKKDVLLNKLGFTCSLIQQGVDIEAKDEHGMNALHWAAYLGRNKVIQLLLDSEADIEAKTSNDDEENRYSIEIESIGDETATIPIKSMTAMHWAIAGNEPSSLQILLDRGANVNATFSPRHQCPALVHLP